MSQFERGYPEQKGKKTVKVHITAKTAAPLIVIIIIFASLFTAGCNSGVSQDDYDEVKNKLTKAQNEIEDLESEIDSLQNQHDAIVDWYDGIREEVNRRLGDWEDEKLFITPNNEVVAAKVHEITGGYDEDNRWADYKKMYDWVIANIEYNFDSRLPYLPLVNGSLSWSNDYWRAPSETLEDEVGDCEDMATLLASMLINYTDKYTRWCISWTSDESAHLAVAFPVTGGKLTILDPAGKYYTGSYYYLDADDVDVAVDGWLDHWKPEPGIHVSGVFSETVYETFDTTEEFIGWVLAE